ncbi:maternal protein exuperantia-1-like [Photinus pyralis]|nr:maternal protein exuperantia-1-like [Photinus pyralis]
MKATLPERRHASHLRRLLAENNIDYAKLQSAYESSAKDGIEGILKNEVPNAKEKDLTELLEILDCFFDPEKKAIQPKPRFFANQNRNPRSRTQSNNNKENGEVNGNNNSTEGSVNTSSSETTPRTVENGIVEQSQPSETVVQ